MARPEDEKIVRKHLWMYENDYEWLEATFGKSIGVSKAVREIVRRFRSQAEARAAQVARPMTTELPNDLPLDELAGDHAGS